MTSRVEIAGPTRETLLRIFDSTADGVQVVDSAQRIVFCNRAAAKLLDVDRDEVLGRPCYEVVAGEDYLGQPFCRRGCPIIEATRRGRLVPNFDIQAHTAGQRTVWLNVSVLAIEDPEGDGLLTVSLFRDITKRRQAEILAQETIEAVGRYQPVRDGVKESNDGPYPVPSPRLTRRELDVLQLLASGTPVPMIARTLGIKGATVNNHIEHILGKLGVHSRLEAVVYAVKGSLV